MSSKLYIGNLSFKAQESELSELFSAHGEVLSARIITDRDSGRSRGFAFIEMADADQASKALEALDGQDHLGRTLRVSIAKEREPGAGGPRRDRRPPRGPRNSDGPSYGGDE